MEIHFEKVFIISKLDCVSCKSYHIIRKFDVVLRNEWTSHCEKCGAVLMKGLISVGEKIHDDILSRSQHSASTSRLSIVLDSHFKEQYEIYFLTQTIYRSSPS